MDNYFDTVYTQAVLDSLIKFNAEESVNLEFKQGDALSNSDRNKKELSKDISAMANSDGGVIIYGIKEQHHKAQSYSFVNGNEVDKEWLENVINSRIQRRIAGLIIEVVRFDDKIEQTVFIVKIPKSINAPHMISEKKFYKRFNFQASEMEEYEIRSLYNRPEHTLLKIDKVLVTGSPGAWIGGKITEFHIKLKLTIVNEGATIEPLYKLELKIPKGIIDYSGGAQPLLKKHPTRDSTLYTTVSLPAESPIFQNEIVSFPTFHLTIVRQNLSDLTSVPVLVKLYYSNGTDERTIILYDHVNKQLDLSDFRE